MTTKQDERTAGVVAALLFTAVAAAVLATAYSYSKASSLLPRFAGWIFLALAASELISQVRVMVASWRDDSKTGDAKAELGVHRERIKGAQGFLWLAFVLAAIYLAGFLVATPLFIFTFLLVAGANGVARSAVIAAVATAVVWLGFVLLLDYELFPGILFDR